MTDSNVSADDLKKIARQMAKEGKTITAISEHLGISWGEARGYTYGWISAKTRITKLLNKLAEEQDPEERKKLVEQVDGYVDFLYDAAKNLRSQVDGARKSLNR